MRNALCKLFGGAIQQKCISAETHFGNALWKSYKSAFPDLFAGSAGRQWTEHAGIHVWPKRLENNNNYEHLQGAVADIVPAATTTNANTHANNTQARIVKQRIPPFNLLYVASNFH